MAKGKQTKAELKKAKEEVIEKGKKAGARLVKGLIEAGVAKEEIAEKVIVSLMTVHRWARGQSAPRQAALANLKALAEKYKGKKAA
ncbi:MAG: hypothetical protein Q7R39_11105 [Dehalococcoidia bacterium]|nr:hypothetical protein [Dehalococcoidia bacterium]